MFGMFHGTGREAVCSLLDGLWWAWAVSLVESSVSTGKGLSQAVCVATPALGCQILCPMAGLSFQGPVITQRSPMATLVENLQ